MTAVFVELPAFERYRADYLDDDAFRKLQSLLMLKPEAGDMIPGAGGLRKMRFADERRGKGKRSGLRVIYYCWDTGHSFGCSQFMTRMKCQTYRRLNAKH